MICKIRGKKGWIKILEAFIAVLIIIGVVLFLNARTSKETIQGHNILEIEKTILNEIAENNSLRLDILDWKEDEDYSDQPKWKYVHDIIREKLPNWLDFEFKSCKINSICGLSETHEEVYVYERVVSSTRTQYGDDPDEDPKKIKLFAWPNT